MVSVYLAPSLALMDMRRTASVLGCPVIADMRLDILCAVLVTKLGQLFV